MLGGSGAGKSTLSTRFSSSEHNKNIKCKKRKKKSVKSLFSVTVVNVEKTVFVSFEDQISKITFVDYAHGEIMVSLIKSIVDCSLN